MGKIVKYFAFISGGLALVLVAAILIVPSLVDVQKYKPVIEEKLADATGRKVSLGGDIKLSLFPWVGVSLADFQIANPEGFAEATFLQVNAFQAHVKVMPLLSREIYVDKIVLDGPQVYLEKRKDGKVNWQGFGSPETAASKPSAAVKDPKESPAEESSGFAVKSIEVGEFALKDGKIVYADAQQGTSTTVSDISLLLKDVSLTRPLGVDFSATFEGKPIGLQGQIGPLASAGGALGKGIIPVDLSVNIADQLQATLIGQLEDVVGDMRYSFGLNTESFSLRDLAKALGVENFPVQTTDPKVLNTLELALKATGTASSAAIQGGSFTLDDSKLTFEANVASFSPLNLSASAALDTIDLDRYLPPPAETETASANGGGSAAPATAQKKTDYSGLRAITLDTKFSAGTVKIKGGTVENVVVQLKGKRGLFTVEPMSVDLYNGALSGSTEVDVRKDAPLTKVAVNTTGVQVGPLLHDFAGKDILEGALASQLTLSFRGDTPEAIKKSLDGKGLLTFTDGAIVGVDLAGMVRNVQASFGLAEKPTEKPKTDFAELQAPFTITDGLVDTPGTTLTSPLIRVAAAGSAHLVSEKLNMKVHPKFVASLKGQGDTSERSGVMVPILIGGTFNQPTFAPDLAGLLQGGLPDVNALQEALQQELKPKKENSGEETDAIEQGIKNLIPQFKF
ncbi:AsmA family protein [Desulfosediminicola sp.]|uniref:AsmA family protein n=1 Tax=Desulfosediminicola sp. TaxID=2886825 RepID=UPI003AF20EB5